MNIVIIASVDPDAPKTGGIKVYVSNLIEKLIDLRVRLMLIGVNNTKKVKNRPYSFIPVAKNVRSEYKFLFNLFIKAPSLRIPKSSIIQVFHIEDIIPFLIFHKKNLKIWIATGNEKEAIHIKRGKILAEIYGLVESFCSKKIDGCIAVSEDTKQSLINRYPWLNEKIKVISTGIDLNKFKPMNKIMIRRKYGFNEEDEIILYIGRLEIVKNIPFLIKTFAKVKKERENAKLIIVGDGRERENLEKLVNETGTRDVIFMGKVDDIIPEIMNCADVFCLCSLHEGSPTVVKEALACGVPVVSTDVGDVKDIFKKDSVVGRIVPKNDELSFAQAIIEKLKQKNYTIERKCREFSKQFDFEAVTLKVIKFMEKCYRDKKGLKESLL